MADWLTPKEAAHVIVQSMDRFLCGGKHLTERESEWEPWESTLVVPLLVSFYDVAIRCMPSRWIETLARRRSSPEPGRWVEWHMVIATLLLIPAWIMSAGQLHPGWIQIAISTLAVAIASARWLEIVVSGLELIVPRRGRLSQASSAFALLFLYVVQATLIFAIAMEVFARTDFYSSPQQAHPESPMYFLYLSWTNLTTLGNSSVVHTTSAEVIVMMTGATGVVLLGLFLSYAISRFSGPLDNQP